VINLLPAPTSPITALIRTYEVPAIRESVDPNVESALYSVSERGALTLFFLHFISLGSVHPCCPFPTPKYRIGVVPSCFRNIDINALGLL
jgi:hypothetical protein